MSANDMHVVMYKMLAYIYDCMKRGIEPQESRMRPGGDVAGEIPYSYWFEIVSQMVDRELLRGVVVWAPDCEPTVEFRNPAVTLEGVEFMQENSMMRKALSFLREAKSTLPFV